MKQYLFFVFVFLSSLIHATEKNLPLHQIVEIDELAYLVSMIKDTDNHISYRTYPFSEINSAGFYKLANQVTNQITINSNDVMLDLGGQNVAGGIVVETGLENVTIKNGTVDVAQAVANAVEIKTGCRNITLKDLHIKNGTTNNASLTGVSESCIKNCDMSGSATGVLICNCDTIIVEDTDTICNSEEGFCMMASTTCTFRRCKAISTGQGNVATTQDIFGFVSDSGYGNIFDHCIASGTDGTAVTSYSSVVAGFALKGTEACSQIIYCEASNSMSAVDGVTIPYGIYLESTIISGFTFSATLNLSSGAVSMMKWSPDGTLLAIATSSSTESLQLYKINRLTVTFELLDSNAEIGTGAAACSWSPDGNFIAYISGNRLVVVEYDRTNQTLTTVDSTASLGATVGDVDWRFDGNYLATNRSNREVLLFKFNRITKKLTQLQTFTPSGGGGGDANLAWRPDGKYLALSIQNSPNTLLRFDESTETLSFSDDDGGSGGRNEIEWSYDGKYILFGIGGGSGRGIYSVNANGELVLEASQSGGGEPLTLHWSPDARYFISGRSALRVYSWNRVSSSITNVFNVAAGDVDDAIWSPDGRFVISDGSGNVNVYEAYTSVQNNIVKNNTVYCNSGNSCPGGTGIYGNSIENLIIDNTAYSNPIPQGADKPVVQTDYVLCLNVFNPLFQDIPYAQQNIGPMAQVPIQAPPDQLLMLKQLNSKLCDIQTKVDLLIAAN